MSIVGPRPQLVRDMVFMSDEVKKRRQTKLEQAKKTSDN